MGRKLKQTFFQRRYTDGQQAHEKMFNIANCYRNPNQNYNEISPHTRQNGRHQKSTTINAGEAVETWESSYAVDGNVNWYSCYEEQYGGSLRN